jgi:bifunctional non-homologous end joining protein LigD
MPRIPFRVSPMLATSLDKPFSRPGWVFEEKYDGVRIVAYKEGDKISLISRNKIERSERYPDVVAAIAKLIPPTIALDGEIVVFDAEEVSRFQLLQRGQGQLQYVVFDCVYADGEDMRSEPLSERRETIERLIKPSPLISIAKRLDADGMKAFQIATERGLEGILAKNLSSPYFEGRSSDWVKIRSHLEEEFVIAGFTEPAGSRQHFGALLLGVYSSGKLVYTGKVGSGFDERTLRSLRQKFEPLIRRKSPFSTEVTERGATFIQPKLVAQIAYTEWTHDGKLRHPVFLGLRDDKDPAQVTKGT